MSERPPFPGHLSDEQLAGYIDGVLPPAAHSEIESHIADCAVCRAELIAASRATADAPTPVRRRRLPWIGIGAAAAAAALVMVARMETGQDSSSMRAGSARQATALQVVSPGRDEVVSARDVQFVWRSMPTIMEYAITVQDTDGRIRWSARTTDTAAVLPDSIAIAAGSVLHWYVDGLRADGRSVGTGLQRLEAR